MTRALTLGALALGLGALAGPASAQTVCFEDQFETAYRVEVLDAAGSFFSLGGVARLEGATSVALTGSAHLRANLDAHVGLQVAEAPGKRAYTIQATILAPAYTAGSGFAVNSDSSNQSPLAFSPAPCPAGPAGPGDG